MLDTPGRRSEMSEDRAAEIVDFLNGSDSTKFCNIRTESSLGQLAQNAYHSQGWTVPKDLGQLVKEASKRLGQQKKRLGLDIGKDRADHLVGHLLGKNDNPYFREEDDICIKRELLRKALAKVGFVQESSTGETHHHLVEGGNVLIEQKYPLPTDVFSN